MEKQELMVTIPAERFEQLINEETRLYIIVQMLVANKFMSVEDILRIAGTLSALTELQRIKEEESEEK